MPEADDVNAGLPESDVQSADPSSEVDQVSDGQENASETVEQTESQSAPQLKEGEFQLHGRTFNQESLKKAYSDALKGLTQATQANAKERKMYQGITESMKSILSDPRKREAFGRLLKGDFGPAAQEKAQDALANAQAQKPNTQQEPQENPMLEEVSARLERLEARREYDSFISGHPELDSAEVRDVVLRTAELEEAGRSRSLEEVYRTEFFDKAAAKFYQKGESKAKAAQAEAAKSKVLGGAPPINKQAPKDTYGKAHSEVDKNQWLDRKMRELGIKFDDEY